MRTQTKRLGLLYVMLTLLAFGGQQAHGDDGQPLTVTTIVNAWKAREAQATAFDFRAAGTEFRPKTTFSAQRLAMAGVPAHGKDVSMPDTSFSIVLRFAVDGN